MTDRVAVAGGVSLQYLKLDLSSKIPQFLIFQDPSAPDGGFLLEVDNWGWGYNFGLLAEPWDGTKIGLTYRSGIDHDMTGTLTFDPTTSPLLGLVDGTARIGHIGACLDHGRHHAADHREFQPLGGCPVHAVAHLRPGAGRERQSRLRVP